MTYVQHKNYMPDAHILIVDEIDLVLKIYQKVVLNLANKQKMPYLYNHCNDRGVILSPGIAGK